MKGGGRPLAGKLLFNMRGGGARLVGDDDRLLAWVSEGDTANALHGDSVEARPTQGDRARVTKVISRARETIVGTYQRQRGYEHLIPDDPRVPVNILIRSGGPRLPRPLRAGDKVLVHLEPWTNPAVSPAGKVVELLGAPGDSGVDMLSVIRTYDLPGEFPDAVLHELDEFTDTIPADVVAGRKDCRGDFVLTIDPDDAKDHDDAISVTKADDGWHLAVHIADVAHFVRPGSALDREARSRGNSTYLADRCIPMLPLRLSADLCSLRAGVDRLAHSVFVDFNAAGRVRKVRFAKTIICVHSRLTYREAFAMLRGEKVPGFAPDVFAAVKRAWELAALVRKHRFAAGSLDLDFPEVKVWLDADGRAERIERVVHDESHQLVEEFMLTANEAVAHEIKNRPAPCIYRIHEKPDPGRLEEFRQLAATCGLRVGDLTQRKEVTKMLAAIRGRTDEFRLKLEFLKSLRRAAYSPDAIGHYGLAKADYLHFTSPIRRYADLVAHRVLAREKGQGRKELTQIAEHISDTERNSASAEQESVLLKKMEFFQRQLDTRNPQEFRAVVREAKPNGLLIEVPDADTTGFIQISMLPGGPYQFDGPRARFVNRRSRRTYGPGDEIPVFVARVDAARRTIDFAPA